MLFEFLWHLLYHTVKCTDLVLGVKFSYSILRTGAKNWTNAVVLFVFIICTIVAFEYIEEYFSCWVSIFNRKLDDGWNPDWST